MFRKSYLTIALAVAVLISLVACGRSLTKAPAATPTAQGVFAPATQAISLGTPGSMKNLSTQTALAEAVETQLAGGPTATPLTPQPNVTRAVGGDSVPPTGTAGPTPLPTVRPVVATPIVGRPATYELKSGEFLYCLARRFNVDPDQLMSVNHLANGEILYPGQVLTIPQTGSFPGSRALHQHPGTFTVGVTSSGVETIYGVACYYGDVDPAAIISANNLTSPYTLHANQQLAIP